MQIPEKYFRWGVKPTVFTLALVPVLWLMWGAWQDLLGANPIETITRSLGEWTLNFLLLTLLISTLRRATGWGQVLRLRRMLGLFAFFYGVLHLLTYLWLDQFFYWEDIWFDIVERPFITVGMLSFVLMVPLALTSFKAAMRKLGKNWQRLHQLVYPIALLGVLHFWWSAASKSRLEEPAVYAILLAVLLGERLWRWAMQRAKQLPAKKIPRAATKPNQQSYANLR